jgi:hypothetical protein
MGNYAVEKQEVEKAKQMYKQKVAALRAVIAVDSDKDEYDNFDKEFQYADENLAEQIERSNYDRSRPQRTPVDGDHLEDEEEILKWVLHLRAETAEEAADEAGA